MNNGAVDPVVERLIIERVKMEVEAQAIEMAKALDTRDITRWQEHSVAIAKLDRKVEAGFKDINILLGRLLLEVPKLARATARRGKK